MEFKIKKNDFLNPFKKISRIITKNPIFPILENVIIKVNKKFLKIKSSNLDIELNAYINKKLFNCYQPGYMMVSGKKILNICRNIPQNAELYFHLIKKKIHIQVLTSLFILNTTTDNNYPKFQKNKKIKKFAISQKILKEMIALVHFSIANNDIRNTLNGMFIEYKSNYLYSVATDGHRLSMYKKKVFLDTPIFSIIINKKSILEIFRLIHSAKKELIQIAINKHYISFQIDDIILKTKLLDGEFPNYQDVILNKYTHCISIPTDKLKESLLKTSILCNTTFKGVNLNFSKNVLSITSHNQEDEKSRDFFYIKNIYEKISFSINVFYLLDILHVLDIHTIDIVFNNPVSSIQIQSNIKKEILYIIMPLKL